MTGQMTLGEVERDLGLAVVEAGSDEWDRRVIDHLISDAADLGVPFSANLIRPFLPALRSNNLIGQRFLTAARRGLIRRVGYVQSDDPGTHAHPIAQWVKAS